MSLKHKAHALAIHCIDFRFQEMIDADLAKRGLNGNCDRIAWPGASKEADKVMEAAKISLRLHNPDKAVIYEHEDCGAYGKNNSLETHRNNAENLANRLKEIKSGIQVIPIMATSGGIREF